MAKSVIFWIYVTHFCYLLRPVRTGTTYTSRACYGSDPPCVQHSINCSDTQKIAIVDAYYTSNTECGAGVSDCSTVNLDNITEKGYHSFNKTELDSLNKICSTGFQCVYPAPWRGASRTFSVVKYQCTEDQRDPDGNDSATVGGAVVSVLVVVFTVLAIVWYLRKRRQGNSENDKRPACLDKESKRKIPDISQSHYQEIDDSKIQGLSSNYDSATTDGMPASPNTHTYFTIEPITGSHVQQNPATISKEDDYDHIGDKPSASSSNYDTTASFAQSLGTRAQSLEDACCYNRLQEAQCTKTVQNDYDSAATAGKT